MTCENEIYSYGITKIQNNTPINASHIEFEFNQMNDDKQTFMTGWIILEISIEHMYKTKLWLSRVYDPFYCIGNFFSDTHNDDQAFFMIDDEDEEVYFLLSPYLNASRLTICKNLDQISLEEKKEVTTLLDITISKEILIQSFYEGLALFAKTSFNKAQWVMNHDDEEDYTAVESLVRELQAICDSLCYNHHKAKETR